MNYVMHATRVIITCTFCVCVTIGWTQHKPIIGINLDVGGESTTSTRLSLSSDYVDAITSAGGIPILLPAITTLEDVRHQVRLCDGFVFTGGRDINPARFNQEIHPSVRLLNPRRENYDFKLIDAVMKARKPFLAVCLGCQEVNVALGGTLIQDIATQTSATVEHKQGERRDEFVHEIQITTGSRLADIVSTTTLGVNSIHHQSCGEPGRGVRYLARDADGIVESFEVKGHPFGLAVQWHPEALTEHPEHLKIYQALVKAARKKR